MIRIKSLKYGCMIETDILMCYGTWEVEVTLPTPQQSSKDWTWTMVGVFGENIKLKDVYRINRTLMNKLDLETPSCGVQDYSNDPCNMIVVRRDTNLDEELDDKLEEESLFLVKGI